MDKINAAYFYLIGQVAGQLELALMHLVKGPLGYNDWLMVVNASNLIKPDEIATILPRTADLASEIVAALRPLAADPQQGGGVVHNSETLKLVQLLRKFDHLLESECAEAFIYHVPNVGAYSTAGLIEKAEMHLSKEAQQTLTREEIADFKKAGECLAFGLYTASGFHAMRSLEAEARRYHRIVTGRSDEVDWTLDPIINGNSGRGRVGLRDQWKKEGVRDDSPLVLIMSLLSTLTHIYRNPIMHPEMVLDPEQAKQVFNVSSVAINAMVADRITRGLSGGKGKI